MFKKNRNSWAVLLLEQLRSGVLENPFDRPLPEGPLPNVPKWVAYR